MKLKEKIYRFRPQDPEDPLQRRGCCGDYKCGSEGEWIRKIYSKEFIVCSAHKKTYPLGGVGNFEDWIEEEKRDRKRIKKHGEFFPRLKFLCDQKTQELLRETAKHIDTLKEKDFLLRYEEWKAIGSSLPLQERTLDKFTRSVRSCL